MPVQMLHTDEWATCTVLTEPGNYHLEGRCEDCGVATLARLNLGEVEDRYHVGRVTQEQYEAYCHLWATLSPTGSRPEWRDVPQDPTVLRIARKLCRAKGLTAPAHLTAVS
ncbi:hypothetical protein [Micromonospora taraxaci]|uniref:hypothetical protein n=1 Tax=Micromonospora taraxaci TaxID=1316803 RepID=UPI0033A93F27